MSKYGFVKGKPNFSKITNYQIFNWFCKICMFCKSKIACTQKVTECLYDDSCDHSILKADIEYIEIQILLVKES